LIALINLGNSNIQSVINALDRLSINYIKTDKIDDLKECDKMILPGVGTFGNGISKLKELNLFDTIKKEVVNNNKPILGICLGMQMLFESSEESNGVSGLGLIKGKVVPLPLSKKYKIPRIGWADSKLNFDFLGLKKNQNTDLYYIHSYYVKPNDLSIVAIETDIQLTSAIKYQNIYGCQFHPEKSHVSGLNIINAFAKLEGGQV
jgi:imidazole glycerol-phosphate synthase subunit HisH